MLRSPKPPVRPETKMVEAFLRSDRPFLAAIVALAHSPWAVACMSGTGVIGIGIAAWVRLG
jgi:hypothetical protein